MTKERMKHTSRILIVLVLVLSSLTLSAQVLDRGDLTGIVRDESGAALSGTTITITQTQTGFSRIVVTDNSGRYRAPLLPVGSYVIKTNLPGFATVTSNEVVIPVGSSIIINFSLPIARITEAVTITATPPAIQTRRSIVSTNLNQTAIATLPINGRDFRDFALLTPGAQQTPGLRSPIRFGGQQGDYSMLSVDGADMTNPFFAEYTGSLETRNFTISQEAVQEFQILTNGFDAEFGRSTGGVINVVTKSGTNNIRSSAFIFLKDEELTANDPFGNPPTEFSRQQFGGSFGGPIAKDKAFLFFAVDFQDADGPITTQFSRDVKGVSIPEFGIKDMRNLEGQTPQKQDLQTFFGRVDFDIGKTHRLTVRANYSKNNTNSFTGGRGQSVVNASPDNFENFSNSALSIVTSVTSVISTNKFNEFKYHFVFEDRPRNARSNNPEHQIADTGSFGRRFFLPLTGDTIRHQLTNSFSYLVGNHDVKLGVDWNSVQLTNNSFIGFAAGTYFFNTLEDLQSRTPAGMAQRFFINGFTPETHVTNNYWTHELGLFIQDRWQVWSNLTVSYGLRFEAQYNSDPKFPILGSDGKPAGAVRRPGSMTLQPVPQSIANDTNNWGPRLGVSWDPTEEGRTVVRGSVGLYYGRTAQIFMPTGGANFQSATAFLFPPPLPYPELFPSIVPPGKEPPVDLPAGSISFVDENFNNPRVLVLNAGVEHEILKGLVLGLDLVYSHTANARVGGFLPFDMNTFPPTGTDEFKRPIGVDSGFTDSDSDGKIFRRQNAKLGAANILSSIGKARYKSVTLSGRKSFFEGTQFQGFYTWSRDKSNADTERDVGVFLGPSSPFLPSIQKDFGIDERDISHRFIFQGTTELPFNLLLSGIVNLRSGRSAPGYTFNDVNGDNATGTVGNHFDRPVLEGQLLPRFAFRQPNFYSVDMRFMWTGEFEKNNLDILFEIFNLLNNSNFESTIFNVQAVNFLDHNTFVGTQRTAQIGIKWRFE